MNVVKVATTALVDIVWGKRHIRGRYRSEMNDCWYKIFQITRDTSKRREGQRVIARET